MANFQGAFWVIPEVLQTIDTKFDSKKIDRPLTGEIDFFKAILLFWETRVEQSMELFQRVLELIPQENLGARNEAEIYFATASQMAGKGEEAIQAYHKDVVSRNIRRYA